MFRLALLLKLETSSVSSNNHSHTEGGWRFYEYFFQVSSGTKLAAKIIRKASKYRVQLNETIPSRFSMPMIVRAGKAMPSILQCTLPHDRPLM